MAVGTTAFPAALDTLTELVRVANNVSTTLAAPGVLATDTSFPLTSATGFSSNGAFTVVTGGVAEVVYYTGVSVNSLTGCTRGKDGTVAAAHNAGDAVEIRPIARHHGVLADALVAVETKLGSGGGPPSAGLLLLGSGAGTSGWTDTLTGVTKQSIGSADPLNPPNQVSPFLMGFATAGAYADSSTTTGGLFHLSSWVDNSGTRPTVGVFGQGRGTGAGANVWGGNFIGYNNNATSTARGVEIDFGNLVAGGTAYGAVIVAYGGNPITGAHIQMQAGTAGSTPTNGIIFNCPAANTQPVSGSLILSLGSLLAATYGLNFLAGSFSTATVALGNVSNAPTLIARASSATSATANAVEVQTSGGTFLAGFDVTGKLRYASSLTATTVGAAGAASALPATPTGYLLVNVNGVTQKVPYYN